MLLKAYGFYRIVDRNIKLGIFAYFINGGPQERRESFIRLMCLPRGFD
jgi:hypothetical protein